jgi:hypothetical protein
MESDLSNTKRFCRISISKDLDVFCLEENEKVGVGFIGIHSEK